MHVGYAKTQSEINVDVQDMLMAAAKEENDILYGSLKDFIINDLEKVLKEIPDASSIQARYARHLDTQIPTPDAIRDWIENLARSMTPHPVHNVLEAKKSMGIPKDIEMKYLDFFRLFLCHLFADTMNRGDEWLSNNLSKAFIDSTWGDPEPEVGTKYLNNMRKWLLSILERG